jgi:predicted AAA+ superfamily ATPase
MAKQGAKLESMGLANEVWGAASIGSRIGCPIAVFTNQTCDPVQGRVVENGTIELKTLWGEIAYQLGGKDAYELIRPNDETRTAPKGIFVKVLEFVGPCVILIDELADYACAASGVSVGSGTLADQTISFIQELSEAVQSVPRAVLVATLPASAMEVANSQIGESILNSLQKRMGRMGADMKPVGDNEIYEVIRKRLFDTVGDDREIRETVDEYVAMYKAHFDEVPSEAISEEYRTRMVRAFPFHPQLIDALHTRWGSDPNFQRTRGVLRLLAAIIADLYKRRNTSTQSQSLIQPCHLNFELDPLISQVTKLWGQTFQTVVVADIAGGTSNAEKVDNERGSDYAQERITSGVANAVFLGSFGGGMDSGWTSEDVHLACGRPGLNWNYTDGALTSLEQRAFYLHASTAKNAKRYWFAVKPTLNKLIVQYRQSIERDELLVTVRDEVKRRVQGERMN